AAHRSRSCHTFCIPSPHPHRPLPSFPTRRSSDLRRHRRLGDALRLRPLVEGLLGDGAIAHEALAASEIRLGESEVGASLRQVRRSEEHTSELQSLRHLVCRLLLEKKKQRPSKLVT